MAELLFWPALLAYGEAAFAYAGNVRRPGRAGRLATWGVRLGWLTQTGLLAAQAARAEGFPWDTWAGSLNLFVWLVVAAYLVWGCRPRYRVLGTLVLPLAVLLLLLARLGGGTGTVAHVRYGSVFLAVHVGFVLIAFAGFTLSAALAALYLWQERQLKRRRPGLLRLRAPSLVVLESLVGRTIAIALPALTVGLTAGFLRLREDGGGVDALMVVTLLTWGVYALSLILRYERGWRGRRLAYLALTGFALVLLVRLGLPLTHFS